MDTFSLLTIGMKTYLIHDNGGRPFKVTVTARKVNVLEAVENVAKPRPTYSIEPVLVISPQKVFIGKDKGRSAGNSILVQESETKYTYIGSEIYSFNSAEPIVKYVSTVGNSDVPYPYAETDTKYILMLEKVVVDKAKVGSQDPYGVFYGFVERPASTPGRRKRKPEHKRLITKTLVPRLYRRTQKKKKSSVRK